MRGVNGPLGRRRILVLRSPMGMWLGGALLWLSLSLGVSAAPIDFSAQDVNGQMHQLSAERGNWVFINIWATWCPPCRKELPELAAFAKAHEADHIKIWGLSVDTISPDEIALFAQTYNVTYPIFKVSLPALRVFGDVPGFPTTFLVNPAGEVVERHVGGIDQQGLLQMLKRNQ